MIQIISYFLNNCMFYDINFVCQKNYLVKYLIHEIFFLYLKNLQKIRRT